MIIRSQDKKRITDDLKLHIYLNDFIKENPKWQIHTSSHDCIGTYSTEEKAIKVLDMIQEEYQIPIYQNTVAENEVATYRNTVFQMPADAEV